MNRRALIASTVATILSTVSTRAQQPSMPVIGFLSSRSPEEAAGQTTAFLRGLKAFGYIDGQNAIIEYRWARGQYDQLPKLASELVGLHPAVIAAPGGAPSGRAAQLVTSTIPIFFVSSDVVRAGLVSSLNRPGGNATGVDLMTGELQGKRLEFLTQLIPEAKIFGFLNNPQGDSSAWQTHDAVAATRTLGRKLVVVGASFEAEFEKAFQKIVENGATAMVVENDPFFDSRRAQLIALASRHGIPAIYHIREFPAEGGLMSYGPNLADGYYQLGIQVGRVLKGAKVSDLPVVRPTRFEFVINLKTARTLGLAVSPSILARADEVIE